MRASEVLKQYADGKRDFSGENLRELEEAYSHGWLLSTSELADLLGLASSTITDYGEQFNDAGFTFTRAGKRKGGEIAWLVGKPKRTTSSGG